MPPTMERSGRADSPPEVPPGFWDGPLGYPQAIVAVLAAFAVGILYHWRMPHVPTFPPGVAWAMGSLFVLVVGYASIRFREDRVVQWLTGVPFAIVSIVAVCLVAGIGAVVPAETLQARFRMESVYASWPFAMVLLAMMVNLVGVSARRLLPLSYKNLVFSLNHLGLAVTVLGGVLSAAGLQRGTLVLYTGQPVSAIERENAPSVKLPFTITLQKFHLETFPPTLALATIDPKKESGYRVTPGSAFVKPGLSETIGGYRVAVDRFYPRAAQVGGVWHAVEMPTAAPAAHVTVTDASGAKVGEGWVSSGGPDVQATIVPAGSESGIFMPDPSPREFRSTVTITQGGRTETKDIRVNEPLSVGPYRLYQTGYDDKMGAASEYSLIEVVRDSGLPVVYTGMFMLLAGAALLLWNGVGTNAAPVATEDPVAEAESKGGTE